MKSIQFLIEGFDPDIVYDAETGCREQGEAAAEMIYSEFGPENVKTFLKVYNRGVRSLVKSGMADISNSEYPTPDDILSNIKYAEGAIKLFQKYQKAADAYFDEDYFTNLVGGDDEAAYSDGVHFPFAPYNRFWYEFYNALKA